MRIRSRNLLVYAAQACRTAAYQQCATTNATSPLLCQLSTVRHTSSAVQRSIVLPRLLDTLSHTYQQSVHRMDGLLGEMTKELDKVWYCRTGCAALALLVGFLLACSFVCSCEHHLDGAEDMCVLCT